MIGMKKLAEELGKTVEEIDAVRREKLSDKHWRKMAWGIAITNEGCDIIRNNYIVPEIYPRKLRGWVKGQCANPRWVWCVFEEMDGKHQVLIPRRLAGKLIGKPITVDEIKDVNGITYRHESLT